MLESQLKVNTATFSRIMTTNNLIKEKGKGFTLHCAPYLQLKHVTATFGEAGVK